EPADAQLASKLAPVARAVLLPLLESRVHGGLVAVEGRARRVALLARVYEGAEHVVAEALADGGDVLDHRQPELLHLLPGADARVHQDLGVLQRAGGENDLLRGEV